MNTRLEDIKTILSDKKAENIEIFDLTSKNYLVDYVVIATTLNSKHAFALLDYLKIGLKPKGEELTIIDLGDIFIHLMSEKYRIKYSLEEFLATFGKEEK